MVRSSQELLTDLELEIMNMVWDAGGVTVREILEQLPKERSLAYTTVSTVLRILEKKQFVESAPEGDSARQFRYYPKVDREDYQLKSVDRFVHTVFNGDTYALAKKLLGDNKLGAKDLEKLISYLQKEE